MKTMKQILTAAVCAVSAAIGATALATEATLKESDAWIADANSQTSGLTRAVCWSITNNFPDPAIDYRISGGLRLRTPALGSSYTFGGKSLIVGSISDGKDGDYSI